MNQTTPWGVMLALFVVGQATEAYGYEFLKTANGRFLVWTSSSTDYFVDSAFDRLSSAGVRAGFDSWNSIIEPSFQLHYDGLHSFEGIDGASTAHLVLQWDSAYGDKGLAVAHTRIIYDVSTGTITEADILLNGESFDFGSSASSFDLQSVVIHEVGHLLGFAHSCGEAGGQYPSCFNVDDPSVLEAVMAPTLSLGSMRREFGEDDVNGLKQKFRDLRLASPPVVESVKTQCTGNTAQVQLQDIPNEVDVYFRFLDGSERRVHRFAGQALQFSVADLRSGETLDIVVRDRSTGAYGVFYDYEPTVPANCDSAPNLGMDAKPEQGEGGCDCNDSNSSDGVPVASFILLVVIGLMLAGRHHTMKIGLVVIFFVSASSADAYRCTRVGLNIGPSLIWTTRQIEWVLSDTLTRDIPDSNSVIETVQKAFQTWETPDCSDLSFVYKGQSSNLRAQYLEESRNENVVVFVETGWLHEPGVVALTSNAYDRESGVILDTDIEINDEFFDWTLAESNCMDSMDLENALSHEIGHFIGLAHPPNTSEFEETTMFAIAKPCESKKQTLEQDDIDGICTIYPKGEPNRQCYPPDGPSFVQIEKDLGYGCQAIETSTSLSIWPLFLLGLPMLRLRQRAQF